MAEYTKDRDDRALEALFASEPIADDGFSRKVLRRIGRRLWIRRLALPGAVVLGLAIALRPAMGLLGVLAETAPVLAPELVDLAAVAPPQVSVAVLAAALSIAALCLLPAFDD